MLIRIGRLEAENQELRNQNAKLQEKLDKAIRCVEDIRDLMKIQSLTYSSHRPDVWTSLYQKFENLLF